MCTLLLAIEQHPRYRLILAANRDEFYDRPTAAAAFWDDAAGIYGGRDLARGGSWLAVSAAGRIAALTNFREPHPVRHGAPSRGDLVAGFVRGDGSAEEYLRRLSEEHLPYSGYNLIVGDPRKLYCYSNKSDQLRLLGRGLYGLSNHLLDTPWPKVARGKEALQRLLASGGVTAEALFAILADGTRAPDDQLPDTGVGLEKERMLSSIFIKSDEYGYGTRSSTVLLVDADWQAVFVERNFDGGVRDTTQSFDWKSPLSS
jgi:uncharacterized protein with NRDE domain